MVDALNTLAVTQQIRDNVILALNVNKLPISFYAINRMDTS